MAKTHRYTLDQVSEALKRQKGLIFLTADDLGCTPKTVSNYLKRSQRLRDEVASRRGRRIDVGEAALDRAVLAGEGWAVQFLLRMQAKDRGYVEKQEIDITGLPPITMIRIPSKKHAND